MYTCRRCAQTVMTIYVITRYIHSISFALSLQPFRTISFLVGFVCTVRARACGRRGDAQRLMRTCTTAQAILAGMAIDIVNKDY